MPDVTDDQPVPPVDATPDGGPAGPVAERLWPGPLGWLLLAAFGGTFGLVLVPVSPVLGGVVAVLASLVAVVLVVRTTPLVSVSSGVLRAGPAHIPVALLGAARTLDREQLRVELGPRLDARAHVCLRAWIRTAVRVEVVDPQDPTPYWVVSTRRPHALVAALEAHHSSGRTNGRSSAQG